MADTLFPEMYDQIQAVEGGAGRPAIDPRILLALWMYAIADGIVPTGLSVQTSLNPAMNCRATVGMSLRDATTNNHW